MSRALKDVPVQTPEMPEGLVTFGEGRDRSFIYAENIVKERPPEEGEGSLPKPYRNWTNHPPTDQPRDTSSPAC